MWKSWESMTGVESVWSKTPTTFLRQQYLNYWEISKYCCPRLVVLYTCTITIKTKTRFKRDLEDVTFSISRMVPNVLENWLPSRKVSHTRFAALHSGATPTGGWHYSEWLFWGWTTCTVAGYQTERNGSKLSTQWVQVPAELSPVCTQCKSSPIKGLDNFYG